MKNKKTKAARNTERGSETVEGGLVLVLTFALMFLLIDLAMSIFVKATLQQAVRQGVRFAITAQNLPSQSYLNDSITTTVQQNALGLLNGTNGACKVSISYFTPAGTAGTAGGGNVVQVAINGYSFTPLGPILRSANPVAIGATASDVMEACPVAGCPPVVNPDPPACP